MREPSSSSSMREPSNDRCSAAAETSWPFRPARTVRVGDAGETNDGWRSRARSGDPVVDGRCAIAGPVRLASGPSDSSTGRRGRLFRGSVRGRPPARADAA